MPTTGPKILGIRSKYHVGDNLSATCLSSASYPPVVLTWYINSDSADSTFVTSQSENSVLKRSQLTLQKNKTNGFFQDGEFKRRGHTSLRLNFKIKKVHMSSEGLLRVKCTARVLNLYWRSSEVETAVISKENYWYSYTFHQSKAITIRTEKFLLNFVLILL